MQTLVTHVAIFAVVGIHTKKSGPDQSTIWVQKEVRQMWCIWIILLPRTHPSFHSLCWVTAGLEAVEGGSLQDRRKWGRGFCNGYFPTAVIKHHGQGNLQKEGFIGLTVADG